MLVLTNVRTADVEDEVIEVVLNSMFSDELDDAEPLLLVRVSVTPAGTLLNVSFICEPALGPILGPVELLPL